MPDRKGFKLQYHIGVTDLAQLVLLNSFADDGFATRDDDSHRSAKYDCYKHHPRDIGKWQHKQAHNLQTPAYHSINRRIIYKRQQMAAWTGAQSTNTSKWQNNRCTIYKHQQMTE